VQTARLEIRSVDGFLRRWGALPVKDCPHNNWAFAGKKQGDDRIEPV
jgi:hypothetical protein